MSEKKICVKCGKLRAETEFFKQKDGNRCDLCKDCLCEHVDNTNPETFIWILEKFDVPYIEKKWVQLTNDIYRKKGKLTSKSVLGTYIRSMNIRPYSDYKYADTDRLNFADQKAEQEATAALQQKQDEEKEEEELRQRLENGEISQAEYNTLSPTKRKHTPTGFIMPTNDIRSDVAEQLTEDDYQYLNLKWGSMYRPDQWVTMETMYNRYANEYEMNVDREEVLKKMCKTSMKMDESLDAGDVSSYKNLAGVFDQLRKSGKFTEAQNKEKEEKYLDTIGELVRLCEEEKGPIINNLPDPDEYPMDIIDYSIKDLKAYNFNLFAGEPHIQDMIETFIDKYEKAEQAEKNLEDDFITSEEDLLKHKLTDQEAADYQRFIESEIEADTKALLKELGENNES